MQRMYNLYSKELRWRRAQCVWRTACGSLCNGLPPHVVIYMDKDRLPSLWEHNSGSNCSAACDFRIFVKSSPHLFFRGVSFCCLFFKCHVWHEYIIGRKCIKDNVGGSGSWKEICIRCETERVKWFHWLVSHVHRISEKQSDLHLFAGLSSACRSLIVERLSCLSSQSDLCVRSVRFFRFAPLVTHNSTSITCFYSKINI